MEPNNQPIPNDQQTPPIIPTPDNLSTEKKVGPIIASLIIVLVLIFAALYIFASRITQPIIPDDSDYTNSATRTSSSTDNVRPVTGTSTEVGSLKADLKASTKGLDNQSF